MTKTEWKPSRLDELGFVGRGKSRHRPRNDSRLYGGAYPFIQTAEIMGADPYITSYSQTYTEFGLQQSKLWPTNTLCMTIAGANTAETAILKFEACFPDSIIGFIPDEKKADLHFVKYSLDLMKHKFLAVTRGATQDNLSLDKLLSFPLAAPPLFIQRRIGGILSAYDDLIENNQRRIKILEEMARSLYREWFVHFRFPGHDKVKMVPSPLGPIPQGWEVVAFTEIADVLSGGTPKTDVSEYWNGNIPFFTPRDASACFYVQDTEKHVTELGLSKCASELYAPDTVFITARGTVGKVALPSVPMTMNQSCYALRGRDGIPQRFLFLMTLQQVDYLKTNTGGATFDTIVVDTFHRMQVVKPRLDIIARFGSCTDAMFEAVNTLQQQTENLRRTRDLLLPRLLYGNLIA